MTEQTELTVTQAMLRLGKCNKTIHNMIVDGRLAARLANGPSPYYLITVASIEAYESNRAASRDAGAKPRRDRRTRAGEPDDGRSTRPTTDAARL